MTDTDYLPDEALAKIEALIPKVAQGFELQVANAWPKKAQVFFSWERPDDVFKRAESIEFLVEVAMCVDTLCKNLRAEREKNTFAVDFLQVAYALGRALDDDEPGNYFWPVVAELAKPYPNFDWHNVMTDGPARVPYEETEQTPDTRVVIVSTVDELGPPLVSITDATPELDVIVVPRSFVEEVLWLQSGTGSEMADRYDRLYLQAEELLS